ncbi:hypothetical protein SC09_contig10orf00052 [Bacillus subtilis]|uniref:Uncharacterized protein n=1 Tax=Bacillus subtilis TaxID=1423 RepID=A0A0D1JBW3_BACIU|nr:hypothetical protein SC09_contig10orf00052 [Bacillus subtilis]
MVLLGKGISFASENLTEWKSAFCLFVFLLDSKDLPLPTGAEKWTVKELHSKIRSLLRES